MKQKYECFTEEEWNTRNRPGAEVPWEVEVRTADEAAQDYANHLKHYEPTGFYVYVRFADGTVYRYAYDIIVVKHAECSGSEEWKGGT